MRHVHVTVLALALGYTGSLAAIVCTVDTTSLGCYQDLDSDHRVLNISAFDDSKNSLEEW